MSVEDEILLDRVRELQKKQRAEGEECPNDPNNTASILKEKRWLSETMSDIEARRRMFAHSRRGFLIGGSAALAGIFGWRWMPDEKKQDLLRRALEVNETISQIFYRPSKYLTGIGSRKPLTSGVHS
jgi:hypothetical protein